MQSSQNQKLTLVITGMHRSGTSLTASILQSCGVSLGKRLVPPDYANAKGYFENLDFVRFHEEVLSSQGIRKEGWTLEKKIRVQEQYLEIAKQLVQENSLEPIWGWKDPRTTLFLDFWADYLPDSKFIFVYRAPWEVVDSLYRRNKEGDEIFYSNPNFAIKLWINYNQSVLDFYNRVSERCILLSLIDIIKEPDFLVEAIKEKFCVALSIPNQDIYDSSLLHNQVSSTQRPALIKQYFPEALDLYDELETKAVLLKKSSDSINLEPPPLPLYDAWVLQDWLNLRRLEKQKSTLQSQLQQVQVEREYLQAQQQNLQEEYERLQSHVQNLQNLQEEYERLQSHLQNLQNLQEEYERLQSHLQNTQAELERLQSHLQNTQAELERSQSHLQNTHAELERSHSQLAQTQVELERSHSQLQNTHAELERSHSQLDQTQVELERSQARVIAMESSKFWKLRTAWFRLKKLIGMKGD